MNDEREAYNWRLIVCLQKNYTLFTLRHASRQAGRAKIATDGQASLSCVDNNILYYILSCPRTLFSNDNIVNSNS